MSVEPLSGTPTVPSAPRNRWVNKLASRFHNRNKNISEFYVQPDDPWRAYFPGDAIKGTVVLTVIKPVRVTHLVVCLHGYVKVFKVTVAPGDINPEIGFLGPGRGRRAGEYMGNGLATLFEDEVVLCGDGRLKEGIYKFKFELELPPYTLPSSLNFERGTISYIITATLTRPITISPTISCHRRITVLEDINIAPFPAPKPRVVSLEPVSKKSKVRIKQKAPLGDQSQETASNTLGVQETTLPLSPAPSEISGSSRRSTSSQSFKAVSDSHRTASVRSGEARRALPGDTIPLRVMISHNRQIRSPHGIIITLYRQGRIDVHPAIPLGPSDAGGKRVYEDFVPKSRTGLSGLSLGTSKNSSVFRKDLFQTFSPLIIDPRTMTATIKNSIRIPEDTFPTITRVPGAMISFRYYVEIVIDLRGKVTAQDRFPWLNMVSSGPIGSHMVAPPGLNSGTTAGNLTGHVLDTDPIRREKGVVAMVFEVVVGTRDSSRRLRPNPEENVSVADTANNSHSATYDASDNYAEQADGDVDEEGHYDGEEYYQEDGYYDHEDPGWSDYPPNDQHYESLEEPLQPPDTQEPEDEKSRLRRAEELLLPSQPPLEEVGAGSSTVAPAPTAPDIAEDDYSYVHLAPSDRTVGAAALSSAMSVDTIVPGPSQNEEPSFPGPDQSDDKQELERRRLMLEASVPVPTQNGDTQVDDGSNPLPSAPILEEEDQLSNLHDETDESLPLYQR
ncbi:pH-response regulator protein palF/RIM8 [Talaromyces atroroseus]|uniref:pH-response regulator protein palF/RIM8 n=1 Tax=Talaromyces atroroseus TaxID=1441469 RepID=A0A225ANX8_TALAT|nr:pH-response regulator protein palF/RIM8 [Talaromyces atroroseus]OKL56666.1 pH-response regulator protein palF/RIM8 [Talaromyces atroroseus]